MIAMMESSVVNSSSSSATDDDNSSDDAMESAADEISNYEINSEVFVDWRGQWWPGLVTGISKCRHPQTQEPVSCFRVHYDNFHDSWDEWVMADVLKPRSPENAAVINSRGAMGNPPVSVVKSVKVPSRKLTSRKERAIVKPQEEKADQRKITRSSAGCKRKNSDGERKSYSPKTGAIGSFACNLASVEPIHFLCGQKVAAVRFGKWREAVFKGIYEGFLEVAWCEMAGYSSLLQPSHVRLLDELDSRKDEPPTVNVAAHFKSTEEDLGLVTMASSSTDNSGFAAFAGGLTKEPTPDMEGFP